MLLRDYRDGYLSALPEGDALIHTYYDVAPSIVKHINQRPDRKEIYRSIWDQYLSPCISMIESDQLPECKERYTQMVWDLKEKVFSFLMFSCNNHPAIHDGSLADGII